MYLCTFWFIIYIVIDLAVSFQKSDVKTRILITPHVDKDGYHTGMTCNVEINKPITFYVIWVQNKNENIATASSNNISLPLGYQYIGPTTPRSTKSKKHNIIEQKTCESSCNYSITKNFTFEDNNSIVFCYLNFKDRNLKDNNYNYKSEKVTLNLRKTIGLEEIVKDTDKNTENYGDHKAIQTKKDVNITIQPDLDRINRTTTVENNLSVVTRIFQDDFINLTCVAENVPIKSKVLWKRYNKITNQIVRYKTIYCNNNTTCQTLLLLPFKDEYNQNVLECLVELQTDDIHTHFRDLPSEKILLVKPLVAKKVEKDEKLNITGSKKVTSEDTRLEPSPANTILIVISLIIILIVAALIFSFCKCRKKINTKEHSLAPKDQVQIIYATPEVHYAALDFEASNDRKLVPFEKAQYSQIVGVIKPKHGSNSNSDDVYYTVPVINN